MRGDLLVQHAHRHAEELLVVEVLLEIRDVAAVGVLEGQRGLLAHETAQAGLGHHFRAAALLKIVVEPGPVDGRVVGIVRGPAVEHGLDADAVVAQVADEPLITGLVFVPRGFLRESGAGAQEHQAGEDESLHFHTFIKIRRPFGSRLLHREPMFFTKPRGWPR